MVSSQWLCSKNAKVESLIYKKTPDTSSTGSSLELARLYGTSVQEVADIIGNQLDCAPHEDISGYIFMVPNWAHKWFRHNGYVARMLK